MFVVVVVFDVNKGITERLVVFAICLSSLMYVSKKGDLQ